MSYGLLLIKMRIGVILLGLLMSNIVFGEGKNWTKPATKPGETISVSQKDVRVLRRASQILDNDSKWNRADDRNCPKEASKFSLYCALYKACVEINGEFDHRLGALEEVRKSVEVASKGKAYEHRLMGFNNDPSTRFTDIKQVLSMTEKRLVHRLRHKPH